jgi:hypothetical protein
LFRNYALPALILLVALGTAALVTRSAQRLPPTIPDRRYAPRIPKTWDEDALRTLEVPLANPEYSPVHCSCELLLPGARAPHLQELSGLRTRGADRISPNALAIVSPQPG